MPCILLHPRYVTLLQSSSGAVASLLKQAGVSEERRNRYCAAPIIYIYEYIWVCLKMRSVPLKWQVQYLSIGNMMKDQTSHFQIAIAQLVPGSRPGSKVGRCSSNAQWWLELPSFWGLDVVGAGHKN